MSTDGHSPNGSPHGKPSRSGIPDGDGGGSPWERILQVPLFFKLTVANAAIVALAALLSGGLALALLGDGRLEPVVGVVGFGAGLAVLAGVAVNTFFTQLALEPLAELEETARAVQEGDLTARAADSPVADRDLRRLIQVFNQMLVSVEESQRKRRELALRLLEAEERERSRLARELYDDLAQRLAAVLLYIPAAERSSAGFDSDRGWSDPVLSDLRTEIGTALETVREIARRLRPPELDELGLVAALEAEARILSERTGLDIRVRSDGADPDLGPEGRLALFRILQEALVNAVRHASPTRIELRIHGRPEAVVGEVQDDGLGFDTERLLDSSGSGPGLQGMQERARYVGGRTEIASTVGQGTRVQARIPRDTGPEPEAG